MNFQNKQKNFISLFIKFFNNLNKKVYEPFERTNNLIQNEGN